MCRNHPLTLEGILSATEDAVRDQEVIGMSLEELRAEFAADGKDLTEMAARARQQSN